MDPGRGSADGETRTNRRAFLARSTSHAEDVVYCGLLRLALSGAGALERASGWAGADYHGSCMCHSQNRCVCGANLAGRFV
eukprot:2711455-Prymnesium_polylepis.1